jgi:hypothetical protein
MLALLAGPFAKIIGIGALVVSLIGGAAFMLHEHDNNVRAAVQSATQAAQIVEMQAQNVRNTAAMTEAANKVADIAASISTIRGSVNAAPHTSTCATSPAIRSMFDGLRHRAATSHDASAASAGGVVVGSGTARHPGAKR